MGEPGGTWIPEPTWVTFYLKRRTTCLKSLLLSLVFVKALDTKPRTKTEAALTIQLKIHFLLHALLTLLFHLLVYARPKVHLVFKRQPVCSGSYREDWSPVSCDVLDRGMAGTNSTSNPASLASCWGWLCSSEELPPCSPVPHEQRLTWGTPRGEPEPCRSCGACEGLRGSRLLHWKVLANLVCCKSNFTIKADILIFIFWLVSASQSVRKLEKK